MLEALVYDTETTGLVNNHMLRLDRQPELIEFYGALCRFNTKGHKIVAEFYSLVKPKTAIDEDKVGKHNIAKITGITNEMLRSAEPFEKCGGKMIKMIESAPLIIAHNMAYDKEIMDFEAERIKYNIKWPRVLCTVEQTVHLKGYRLSMSNLHEYLFNEKFDGAHRAKIDTQALIRCIAELHKRGIV